MGIFDRFRKREVIDANSIGDPLLIALLRGDVIDRNKVLAIPVVSGYVDLICNTFAMIPFKLYKETIKDGKKVTEEIDDERVNIINYDTTDTLDGFQFKKAICEDYLLGKGGYAHIKKISNKFKGLFYVECDKVAVQKNTDPIFKSVDFLVNGITYKNYDFIKLLRNTKDGASGVGLTVEIEKALQTAFKRLTYEFELTATGGSRKGFIKSNKHLDKKAIEDLKTAWENYYSGNANTVILNDGMEFQEASNTSRENEINEKNKTFADEVRIIFHIGNTYDDFIKNAIMPIATAFTTGLNRDFLLEKEKKDLYFAPDTKELLKGSLKERYDAYKIAVETGFKTRNEIRYMEDDDYIEGLDMINLGLGDVLLNVKTGEIYTPNTNKMVKMGENTTKVTQNPQENVDNEEENNKITPNLLENTENNEDLGENNINIPKEEKTPKIAGKLQKKGGVKNESGS